MNVFLRKQFYKYYPQEVIELAIRKNPASAGIPSAKIEKLAKPCINNETMRVTSISAAAGIPGGFAMIGTIPADVAQYFAHIIRVLQKLVYLYGWKEIYNSDDSFDDETMNQLTLFLGVMFGVNAANTAITKIGKTAAKMLSLLRYFLIIVENQQNLPVDSLFLTGYKN